MVTLTYLGNITFYKSNNPRNIEIRRHYQIKQNI